MDTYMWLVVGMGLAVCYTCMLLLEHVQRPLPGPFRLPLIGTLYYHGITPPELTRLGHKYGHICSIYLGPIHFILLNTSDTIRQAAKSKIFIHRGFADSFTQQLINPNCKGMSLLDYTKDVEECRRSCIKSMRDLGVGRVAMEKRILEEADQLVTVLKSYGGKAIDCSRHMNLSAANLILDICFNVSYDHGDPELLDLLDLSFRYSQAFKRSSVLNSLPILRYLPPFKATLKDFIDGNLALLDFIWQHTEPFIDANSPKKDTCFVRQYIDNCEELDTEQLKFFLKDLLFGGFETTSATLMWMILFLANRPHIQAKVQAEIDDVLGERSALSVSDKEQLPYTEALIAEVQRLGCVGTMMFYKSVDQDSMLFDATVPAGTRGIINYYSIHMSEDMWPDPKQFKPERFLNSEGKFESKANFTPYGLGKRHCVGEALAKQSVFLFATRLLQEFTFVRPGDELISEQGTNAIVQNPETFQVKMLPRKK